MYFDDFKITHVKSPVISSDDYYAGGSTFNSFAREDAVPNATKFQETEWQDEIGLNLYDFDSRLYDPYIWRTPTLDPHAEDYAQFSPYSFLNNNPISFTDPTGMDAMEVNGTSGQAICPDCPNNPTYKPYIDDPNNYYHYDPQTGTATKVQMLPEVTVTSPNSTPEAEASSVALPWWLYLGLDISPAGGTGVVVGAGTLTAGALTIALVFTPASTNNGEMEQLERMRAKYIPAPKTLPGFPGAQKVKRKAGRARWKDTNGDILEWDSQHGDLEVYDKTGKKHKGSADPETGEFTKPPDPRKTTEN